MRLQQYLINEEYETRIEFFGKSFDLFVNPSQKDARELTKRFDMFRFIADNNSKKIYAWLAGKATHGMIYKKLFGSNDDMRKVILNMEIIPGIAEVKKGKSIMYSSDFIEGTFFDDRFDFDKDSVKEMMNKFSWVNKYIDIKRYFIELMKEKRVK